MSEHENIVDEHARIIKRHIELMRRVFAHERNIGELHAAFDDAVDRYVAFCDGRYDLHEHVRRLDEVIARAARLRAALPDVRQPWIMRRPRTPSLTDLDQV